MVQPSGEIRGLVLTSSPLIVLNDSNRFSRTILSHTARSIIRSGPADGETLLSGLDLTRSRLGREYLFIALGSICLHDSFPNSFQVAYTKGPITNPTLEACSLDVQSMCDREISAFLQHCWTVPDVDP